MSHDNAQLTPAGRLRLAKLVVDKKWTLRRAAERWNCSVTTTKRCAYRDRLQGAAGIKLQPRRATRSLLRLYAGGLHRSADSNVLPDEAGRFVAPSRRHRSARASMSAPPPSRSARIEDRDAESWAHEEPDDLQGSEPAQVDPGGLDGKLFSSECRMLRGLVSWHSTEISERGPDVLD